MTVQTDIAAAVDRLWVLDQASALAVLDVVQERLRQIEREGWTPQHDDEHGDGELAKAASAYALHAATGEFKREPPKWWPWYREDDTAVTSRDDAPIWGWVPNWWKPKAPMKDLTRAGALVMAEVARTYRQISGERHPAANT